MHSSDLFLLEVFIQPIEQAYRCRTFCHRRPEKITWQRSFPVRNLNTLGRDTKEFNGFPEVFRSGKSIILYNLCFRVVMPV
jgi:hypothetical protein